MSKKRKRKRRHSSSSEDDRARGEKDVTRSHVRRDESVSASTKDDSRSGRKIKKPVYSLPRTHTTEHKPAHERASWTETKRDSVPVREEERSSRGSKTVETPSSKRRCTDDASPAPQTTKKSEQRSDRKSSWSSAREQGSTSSVSSKQKDSRQHHRGERAKAEVPAGVSSSKDAANRKRDEVVEDKRQQLQAKKSESETSFRSDEKHPFPSASKISFKVVKRTAAAWTSSNWIQKDNPASGSTESQPQKTTQSSSTPKRTYHPKSLALPFFKIPPKNSQSKVASKSNKNDAVSTVTHCKDQPKPSESGVGKMIPYQRNVEEAHRSVDVTPQPSFNEHEERASTSSEFPVTTVTKVEPCCDQVHVAQQLHVARSERKLEVNLMETYGELTCMDIDPPEEVAVDTQYRHPAQGALIIVLDTNILLSHLVYVKKIQSVGFKGLGSPVILIPWVVLQELDCLKKRRDLPGSVAHLAIPAISYIHNTLKSQKAGLWGQSMQQAAACRNDLNAENNDDRVLQCCLQYQSLYPEYALILCTDDKNLCSKAVLSGVKALSKADLEAEDERSRHGALVQQHIQCAVSPHINPPDSSPMVRRSFAQVQPHVQESAGSSLPLLQEKDTKQPSETDKESNHIHCIYELKDCLREVLSDILEVEMEAIYKELWTEIVYRKPPWTLEDVLQCFKKHWIAVFGAIVPRKLLQTVLYLIDFFKAGDLVDVSRISEALQEARKLVKAFQKRSRHFPRAMSVMDQIFNELQPRPSAEVKSSASDVVMNESDDEEGKQPSTPQLSHQEVWAMFEGIWSNVFQTSLEVFKALGFDPHTMQSAQPTGGCAPPRDALACLHKLFSMVSQLLQAFSSVLSSGPDMENVQTLIGIIHSSQIVADESRVTAKDLLVCFQQPDYREKLQFGGRQLMELQEALTGCMQASAGAFTT